MSVSIRLRREGTRNRPYYRVVVADSRSPRDGKFIEIIGTYDPKQSGQNTSFDLDRAEYWISQGAQPSDTVRSLIKNKKRSLRRNRNPSLHKRLPNQLKNLHRHPKTHRADVNRLGLRMRCPQRTFPSGRLIRGS